VGRGKLCPRCGKYEKFNKTIAYCKPCNTAYHRERYSNDHLAQSMSLNNSAVYVNKNRVARREYQKKWYYKNRKHVLAASMKRYYANYEHIRAGQAIWRANNKDKIHQYYINRKEKNGKSPTKN
jgi:hypothetical protein